MAGLAAMIAVPVLAVNMLVVLMAFIVPDSVPADGECVICHTSGEVLDPAYGATAVCADVRACTRRKQAQLAADGKLEPDF